ncbi:acyltransferase [Nocardiopsis sp. NRRL B-16309]|uniref:acyltransferase n=1 Tax=Nocardiopsis sp. NRRL B-16309 TaxID=1519494 RepID=UPI0006B05C9B|nr:acyltransferase family protein [Nocardiopsis sp. NRRL B-16309]KOX17110.1 acyltransferase [Nocardiopsis sp. NRRL B-16309]
MRVDVPPSDRPVAAPPTPVPTTWIEFARVAAMAAVVLVHAFSPLVSTIHADLGGPAWWAAHVVDSALRWCVPVFVMISGGLLLRPREEDAGEFYRRRWARIGVPLVVWTIAYLVWQQWRDGIGASTAAAQAASGSPSIHLYFLYVIAGLYLLTPFLRTVVAHTPRTGLWWFAGLTLALGAADQALRLVDGVGGVTAATRFLPFLGYYLLGWLMLNSGPGPRSVRYGFAAFVLGTTATAAGAWAAAMAAGEWGEGAEYVYGFLSPTVVLASAGAFVLLRAAGSRLVRGEPGAGPVGRTVATLSGLSLGVYLVHVMVLNTLRDIGGTPDGVLAVAAAGGYAIATAAVSLLLVAVMRRVPLLRATV